MTNLLDVEPPERAAGRSVARLLAAATVAARAADDAGQVDLAAYITEMAEALRIAVVELS